MSLGKREKELVTLFNSVGELSYEKPDDEGWVVVSNISAFDEPRCLYEFFKEVALHFKALSKEEDDF